MRRASVDEGFPSTRGSACDQTLVNSPRAEYRPPVVKHQHAHMPTQLQNSANVSKPDGDPKRVIHTGIEGQGLLIDLDGEAVKRAYKSVGWGAATSA